MKLVEALKIVQTAPPANAEKLSVFLACGFLPLHLATFLDAYLRQLAPERRIVIETGIYGDLSGNLERLRETTTCAGGVVFEWADFDSRLGLRSLGGWGPNVLADILNNVQLRADRFLELLKGASSSKSVVIALPSLPLPPVSYHPVGQASLWQLQLVQTVNDFAACAAAIPGVKVLNPWYLEVISPLVERLDVKSELSSGFPYRTAHADRLANALARLIQPSQPKKGLITDLDDTFWRGLLGEDGVAGISWDLDRHSHINALYQQLLLALSDSGVLIAVASKNDCALALEVFEREDMLMPRDRLFPFEVNWDNKSESIGRILQVWNVSPDSVVFVDDSPMELAEVKSVFPEMECLSFPCKDDQGAYILLESLRHLFGKEFILEEDTIRLSSIRRGAAPRNQEINGPGQGGDHFLRQAEARLTLCLAYDPLDMRPLELINKTNQFNLNGRRMSKAELEAKVVVGKAFFLLVSYEDKYGPLGKIAALLGNFDHQRLYIDSWVMSCRAFSRRIEYKCLEYIFDELNVSEIIFDFKPTIRNKPMHEFLTKVFCKELNSIYTLDREIFNSHKPALYHTIKGLIYA
jgi:FkbH-like protein